MTAGPSGAHPVPPPGWLRRSLLCLLGPLCSAARKQAPGRAETTSELWSWSDSSLPAARRVSRSWNHGSGSQISLFFFVSSSLQIVLNLLHFTETELALNCYSVVLRCAYRWGSHFGIGAYIWGGRKPTAATGASHVVHSLMGSADGDTFLHNHPLVLCQMPQEPALG